jgi:site-specific DNA-methyltransferase (adenine-specific)
MTNGVYLSDNMPILEAMPTASIPLIYIDPPFNTGRIQRRIRHQMVQDGAGDRTGFGGRRYRTTVLGTLSYEDIFDDYPAFLAPRLEECYRILTADGTIYVHLDQREVHYIKVLLDQIFGRTSFLNEIIWAWDYGAKTKRHWPRKHQTILMYVKDPANYVFNVDAIDRVPYLAPNLVGPEKAACGKLPTDVWWQTIPSGKERTGYPTQKPLVILKRIIAASSRPRDTVLDCFAGSGTTGEAAHLLGRNFIMIDNHPDAFATMARRLVDVPDVQYFTPPVDKVA